MKIGIIAAMDKELSLLLPLLSDTSEIIIGSTTFHTGHIGCHDVAVCGCGIGKVNAALGTAALTDTFHPALVINTGVAGGTGAGNPPVRVMDILMPEKVSYHDVWCGPGTIRGQAAGCPATFDCPLPDSIRRAIGAQGGMLASGDIFVDGNEALERVLAVQPEAVAVDMESAAIAQVCHTRAVPFACLRVISDTPDKDGNSAAYENFWATAPERTFHAVELLLGLL